MIREISSEISNDRTYEVIMEMLGLGIGAYYGVDARGEFALVEMPCSRSQRDLYLRTKEQRPHSVTLRFQGSREPSALWTYLGGKEL